MLGRAPVLDFDGTIAVLDVDWVGLRKRLGVTRIDDLWTGRRAADWEIVARAETDAARVAEPVETVCAALGDTAVFAVLTSNSERCVRAFFDRWPDLAGRLVHIAGRETLAGPKSNFARFSRAYRLCAETTASWRGSNPVVYVGDAAYELAFAGRLGAFTLHPKDLVKPV